MRGCLSCEAPAHLHDDIRPDPLRVPEVVLRARVHREVREVIVQRGAVVVVEVPDPAGRAEAGGPRVDDEVVLRKRYRLTPGL